MAKRKGLNSDYVWYPQQDSTCKTKTSIDAMVLRLLGGPIQTMVLKRQGVRMGFFVSFLRVIIPWTPDVRNFGNLSSEPTTIDLNYQSEHGTFIKEGLWNS